MAYRRSLCLGLLLSLLAGSLAANEPEDVVLWVSPGGDDAAAGTETHPLRTLEGARDLLRQRAAEAGFGESGATVFLAEGRYAFTRTFRLGAEDGGRRGAPLRYVAAPDAEVVLHGGVELRPAAFQSVDAEAVLARLASDEARHRIRVADLDAAGVGALAPIEPRGLGRAIGPAPAELFLGGVPLTLARWPNEGFVRTGKVIDPGARPRDGDLSNRPPVFRYEGTRPERWLEAEGAWLYGYWFHDWADESLPLAAVDPETRELRLGLPHRYGVKQDKPYFAENLLEELDASGEYYVDRTTRRLYLWPPDDAKGRLILTTLGVPLIHVDGASHLVFRGLTLETTRADAVLVEGGEGVHFEACAVENTGARAFVIKGGKDHVIDRCRIHHTGEGGIHLEGGNRELLRPSGHVVRDCDISEFSRRTQTYRPAVRLQGCGHQVLHNRLHHAPHAAIIFTGNDHLIASNEIDHVLRRTGDGGAVYCGRDWTLGGTVIRHNYFHDLSGIGKWENAIYLDDQASGIHVIGNRIERCHLGMLIGGGRSNRIEGNLIVDCTVALRFGARGLGWAARMRPLLEERLAAVPIDREPWCSRFPWLRTLLEDEPMAPRRNVLRANVLVRSGTIDAHLSKHVTEDGTVEANVERTVPPCDEASPHDPDLPDGFDPVRPQETGPRTRR